MGKPYHKIGIDWDKQPLGEKTDRGIAQDVGCHHSNVVRARNARGIPPYRRPTMAERRQGPPTQRSVRNGNGIPASATASTEPAPQPSVAPPEPAPEASASVELMWRCLFIPDAHIPYHDRVAWAVTVAAAREFKPHIVVVLGDLIDFYQISRFSRSPTRQLTLEDEVCATRDALDELDTLGAQWKLYIAGNHEERMATYLATRAPELFDLVSVEDLLSLSSRGWQFKPYREHAFLGKTLVTHDLQQAGVTAIRTARTHAGCGVIIGHTHRMGMHFLAEVDGVALPAVGFGWLGRHEMADYRTRHLAQREWVHGFGIGHMSADGLLWPQCIPIINGSCCVEGIMVSV